MARRLAGSLLGLGVFAKDQSGMSVPRRRRGMGLALSMSPGRRATCWHSPERTGALNASSCPVQWHSVRSSHDQTYRLLVVTIAAMFVAAPWYVSVGVKTDWEWTKSFSLFITLADS